MRAAARPVHTLLLVLLALGCSKDREPIKPSDEEPPLPPAARVDIAVDVDRDRSPISPLIYGSNQDYAGNVWTIRRLGGNRLTGYNWETNASNAGNDWHHSSDNYLVSSGGVPDARVPAAVVTRFHDQSLAMGAASIVTLQMAGYASADTRGEVTAEETAPSARWVKVVARKGAPFRASPDTADGTVYMDELVSLLVSRYGAAGSARGIRWYSLDNEPCLWASTHPRIHPQKVGAQELLARSIELASAVKAADPQAGILGPVSYGMNAYVSLQDAPDWPQVKGSYRWFLDWYLAGMRRAEATAGRRLLDALDVHWYPEAQGDTGHRITDDASSTVADQDARLQAPRTLWDPTYREKSWVAQYLASYLPLLPTLKASIDTYYPGTKLAITEYSYGGGDNVTGGLAQADVLGVFGRYGVDIATLWGIRSSDAYTAAAFRLFRDYDGKGGTFGATAVHAAASDAAAASAWAAVDGDATLHLVLINKTRAAQEARVTLQGSHTYTAGSAWGLDGSAAQVKAWPAVDRIAANALTYRLPALSAVHLVVK